MVGRHSPDLMTKARDELMSHTVRCQVLEAEQADRVEWLEDTIEYIAGRYPGLTDIQLAQLELMGRQYIKPAIAHGSGFNAVTERRPDPSPALESESVPEGDEPSAEAGAESMESEPELALAGAGAV